MNCQSQSADPVMALAPDCETQIVTEDQALSIIGNNRITHAEQAAQLFRLAQRQYGKGDDLFAALSTLDRLIDLYPSEAETKAAISLRDIARGEATSLNFILYTDQNLLPESRIDIMLRLGLFQAATDYIYAETVKPDQDALLRLYRLGYLCAAAAPSGLSRLRLTICRKNWYLQPCA